MCRGLFSTIVASLLLSLIQPCVTRAELITVRFVGTVDFVRVLHRVDRPELREIVFPEVGDVFSGHYTFDSTVQDSAAETNQGSWYNFFPDTALAVRIGGFTFEGQAINILTSQNRYSVGDGLPSLMLTSNQPLSQSRYAFNFSLSVFRENLFSDPNILPIVPPSLDDAVGGLSLSMRDFLDLSPASPLAISASLDYLAIVPEPPCICLLMISGGLVEQFVRTSRKRGWNGNPPPFYGD